MAFDEERYNESFIKPLRGKALPDDLAERYAILSVGPNPTADELRAHLATVRAFWNKGSSRLGPAGQVCQICNAADELLKRTGVELDGIKYDLDEPNFWTRQVAEYRKAAAASVLQLTSELKKNFGSLGAVTKEILKQFQNAHGLNATEVDSAVSQAGLAVVETIEIPDSPPIPQFKRLTEDMSKAPVRSVPELINPKVGNFTLVDRVASSSDSSYRFDLPAIEARAKFLSQKSGTASELAAESGLRILASALRHGIDLRDIAIFHLASAVRESAAIAGGLALDELRSRGLVERDAAVIVLSLLAQGGPRRGGLAKVAQLVEDGQLDEARQALAGIPDSEHDEAQLLVSNAEGRLASLLGTYKSALKSNDEAAAARALNEAVGINEREVIPLLDALAPSPPFEFRASSDKSTLRMFWKSGAVHDKANRFVVMRHQDHPPTAPGDGTEVYSGQQFQCTDDSPPVARRIYYSAFCVKPNGTVSRPATIEETLLPPVFDVAGEVGPTEVTVSWGVRTEAVSVEVRVSKGTEPEVAVNSQLTSCYLSDLAEGVACSFRIRALYRGADGGPVGSAWTSFSAVPRGVAKAVTTLTTRLINDGPERRLELTWVDSQRSEVRFRRSNEPPTWTTGAIIDLSQMSSFGVELRGNLSVRASKATMEVMIPPGVHHIVPFSVGGNGVVVGTMKVVATIEPVTDVAADSFKGIGRVSWIWPTAVRLAEVSWNEGGERHARTIGISEYHAQGVEIPLANSPRTIEVRALASVDGRRFHSPPATVELPAAVSPRIGYEITGASPVSFLERRKKLVTFRSESGCPPTRVHVIAVPGRIMPTHPSEGVSLLEVDLQLEPGGKLQHEVTIPKSIQRPFWIRCFSMDSDVYLAEPATSSLKVE